MSKFQPECNSNSYLFQDYNVGHTLANMSADTDMSVCSRLLCPCRDVGSLRGQKLVPSRRPAGVCVVVSCLGGFFTWDLERRVSSNTDSRSLQRKSRLLIKATFDPWNEALLHQTPTPERSFKDYFRLTWYICPNPHKDNCVISRRQRGWRCLQTTNALICRTS